MELFKTLKSLYQVYLMARSVISGFDPAFDAGKELSFEDWVHAKFGVVVPSQAHQLRPADLLNIDKAGESSLPKTEAAAPNQGGEL